MRVRAIEVVRQENKGAGAREGEGVREQGRLLGKRTRM